MSFPDPESRYYLCASYPMHGGQTFTAFIEGPFKYPDQARQARDRIREKGKAGYTLHCVEVADCSEGGAHE